MSAPFSSRSVALVGITVVALLVGASVALGVSGTAEIPADKAEIAFETPLGTVRFAHQTHADRADVTCQTCHHKTEAGQSPAACETCHATGAPSLRDAMHGNCGGCHDALEGSETAPGSKDCMGCHVRGK